MTREEKRELFLTLKKCLKHFDFVKCYLAFERVDDGSLRIKREYCSVVSVTNSGNERMVRDSLYSYDWSDKVFEEGGYEIDALVFHDKDGGDKYMVEEVDLEFIATYDHIRHYYDSEDFCIYKD